MNTEMIVCDQCNAPLQADSRFCRNCDRSLLPHAAAADQLEERLSWETNISLLTNPLILKQTALMVFGAGLVMAFIMSFLLAVTGDFGGIPFILLVFLLTSIALALFTCLIMLLFFGNRMRVRFTVDGKGVLWEAVDKWARATGRLAIVASILGRSPQTAGALAVAADRLDRLFRNQVSAWPGDCRHTAFLWRPGLPGMVFPESPAGKSPPPTAGGLRLSLLLPGGFSASQQNRKGA